ncbi:MAG: diguanylate cyclase, partial [Noviherbaspirillum sp.]
INDRVGHQGGDEVLREVAARIKVELRLSDALGRFGGEEFVVLLIDAELGDALNAAERIRLRIAEQPMRLSSGENFDVTVSIGVAALVHSQHPEPIETTAQRFVERADRALYQAKASGRNQVVGDR